MEEIHLIRMIDIWFVIRNNIALICIVKTVICDVIYDHLASKKMKTNLLSSHLKKKLLEPERKRIKNYFANTLWEEFNYYRDIKMRNKLHFVVSECLLDIAFVNFYTRSFAEISILFKNIFHVKFTKHDKWWNMISNTEKVFL